MTVAPLRPAVYLHIGEPKSGTTFVQQVLWRNRDALGRAGVLVPGLHPQEHYRAQLDLREVPQQPDDPTGSYAGEWDLLARQALRADRAAVISAEQLAAATAQQARRALASFADADIHLVLSLRSFPSLLPAEWQETVKHRNQRTWPQWLERVRAAEDGDRRLAAWFWQVHDTPEVLRRWTATLPPERVHVVPLPPAGAPRAELWHRFAGVLGVDPGVAELGEAAPNESLGLAEAELLRRLNTRLRRGEVGPYAYRAVVKERLAHGYLAGRPARIRPQLPADAEQWARRRADQVVATIRDGGYDVAGDLADLLPPQRGAERSDRSGGSAPLEAVAPPPEAVLDAAVGSLATVLRLRATPRGTHDAAARVATIEASLPRPLRRLAGDPRVRRAVRDLSSRYPALGRLRVTAWRLADRARPRSRR